MTKYTKTPYAKYLKSIKCTNTYNQSARETYGFIHDRLTQRQFKLVLPMIPKDTISGKGSNLMPSYPCIETMNLMISCLKQSDYNESACGKEILGFVDCYKKFTNDCSQAAEMNRKGIFQVDQNQSRFPVKFMQKMMEQYKTPKRVDNGPEIPPHRR